MFLTEEQVNERLNSEKNLANRFSKGTRARVDPNHGDVFNTQSNPDAKVTEQQEVFPQVTIIDKPILLSGKNRANLTEEERTDIALKTRTGVATQTEVARAAGLSTLAVHNIHKGKVKGIDEERIKAITNSVRDSALDRLMHSLGLLTDDKLSGCSAKDLSVIASNMGRVVEKIQPKETQPDNINFIIYAPELKQERAFETVEI